MWMIIQGKLRRHAHARPDPQRLMNSAPIHGGRPLFINAKPFFPVPDLNFLVIDALPRSRISKCCHLNVFVGGLVPK